MQYNSLLTRIAADIYSNGAELITGDLLQNVLNDMVGALASAGACYKGTITPASAAPLDLDQPTVYLALTAGTYTNFVDSNNDPIVTTGPALITYDGGAQLVFSKTDLPSGSPDAVLYTPQALIDPQKAQARSNIGAASAGDLPWSRTIVPDPEEDFPVISIWINGGCILAVDSIGDNSFHGVLNISDVMDITAASFVGAGGIDTDVDVKIGYDDSNPERKFVCIEYTQDQPVVITCLAGTAPNIAESGDVSPILDETDSLPWTELGAGGGSDVFVATYGSTHHSDILAAYNSGKLCEVFYNSNLYILTRIDAGSADFMALNGATGYRITCGSDNSWYPTSFNNEQTSNKVSSIDSTNYNSAGKYPSLAALNASLYKWGVISQTQTWSGTGSNPRTYTIDPASIVRGIIPQANIDLFEAAGAVFNETSGYFELNGLTDISYEEMLNIWHRGSYDNAAKSVNWLLQGTTARTNIVTYTQSPTGNLPLQQTCGYTELEVFAYANDKVNTSHTSPKLPNSLSWTFVASYKLRKFLPFGVNASGVTTAITNAFSQCYSLEDVRFDGLNVNIDFSAAPNFTAASVAYLVEHAGTAAIIIKLHATAYARANADADVQAALSAHTNVSLQSA